MQLIFHLVHGLQALHNEVLGLYNEMKTTFSKLLGLFSKLRKAVIDRQTRFSQLRRVVQLQVSNQFSRYACCRLSG